VIRALAGPMETLAGMPFIDDQFAATRLLGAVAGVRCAQVEKLRLEEAADPSDPSALLLPEQAIKLAGARGDTEIPATSLDREHRAAVSQALEGLVDGMPAWTRLVRLPVSFALLSPSNGAISASSRRWPQHVLLADEAFATALELREQLAHELCHQWLYLIEEIWTVQTPTAPRSTLPSGTRDRPPAEVLGAAHVAIALRRLYTETGTGPEGRIEFLTNYARGCLATLAAQSRFLTTPGRQMSRHLREAL
jgi:hypothetical protein